MRWIILITVFSLIAFFTEAAVKGENDPQPIKALRKLEVDYGIRALSFSPNGKVLAVADRSVRFWDVATWKKMDVEWTSKNDALIVKFLSNELVLFSENPLRTVSLREFPSGKIVKEFNFDNPVNAVASSEKHLAVSSGGSPFQIDAWDRKDYSHVWKAILDDDYATSLDISPNQLMLAAGTSEGFIHLYKTKDGSKIQSTESARIPPGRNIRDIKFIQDGEKLLSAPSTHKKTGMAYGVQIWKDLKGSELDLRWNNNFIEQNMNSEKRLFSRPLKCIVSPDEKIFLVSCSDGVIRVYNTKKAELKFKFSTNLYPWQMAFSPDGKLLAIGGEKKEDDQFLLIVDVKSW